MLGMEDNAAEKETSAGVGRIALGCFGITAFFVLLSLGSCQLIRFKDKAAIVADLPDKLRVERLESLDVCSRVFGGYSFVAKLPTSVSQQIKKQGLAFFRDAIPSKDIPGDFKWNPASAMPRSTDGFSPHGLSCLSTENKKKYRIFDKSEYPSQSYFVRVHPRSALYVIPRLNVVIGGFDTR
jgi:hypothetical protein